jgi:hypothetical protein
MKARRPKQEGRAERRRGLVEVNLLSEQPTRLVKGRRGCALPLIGIGFGLLVTEAVLRGAGS